MKITKSMKLAAILAAGSATALQATPTPVNIHITGSTAFRGAAETAIANILTSPKATWFSSSGAATIDKADMVTFTGNINTQSYQIYVAWSGSEAGIAAVAAKTTPLQTVPFLSVTGNTLTTVNKATAPAVLTGGHPETSPTLEGDHPDACLSDGWQASTPFHGTVAGTQYLALTGNNISGQPGVSVVGVVPFKFVGSLTDSAGNSYAPASFSGGLTTTAGSATAVLDSAITGLKSGSLVLGNGNISASTSIVSIAGDGVTLTLSAPAKSAGTASTTFDYAGLSNITDNLARNVFTSASGSPASLAQFTGSLADAGVDVIAVGRNHDSGTRNAMVLSTGIDKAGTATTAIQQYYPLDIDGNVIGTSGAGTTIADLELVPAESINGFAYSVGKSGYSSGGNLAKVFTATNSVPNTVFVTYLSTGDAKTALGGNAQELSYDGVYYSPTAVQQGAYGFWSYEHLYYPKTLAANVKSIANSIALQLATSDAASSGLVIDSNFAATRDPATADGSIIIR